MAFDESSVLGVIGAVAVLMVLVSLVFALISASGSRYRYHGDRYHGHRYHGDRYRDDEDDEDDERRLWRPFRHRRRRVG